jgi:hypothetical protein
MEDFEQHSWSIARGSWLILSGVMFLLGIALGMVMRPAVAIPWASSFASHAAAKANAAETFDLSRWAYPQAHQRMGAGGGELRVSDANGVLSQRFLPDLYAYSTTDSLEKVWAHYLKLADVNTEGNLFTSGTLGQTSDVDVTQAYVDEPGGHPFRSATLVAHRGSYTVAAFLSRADNGTHDNGTHMELAVQQMPR